MKKSKVSHHTLVPDFVRRLKTYQAGKPIDELAREKNLKKITKLASNENPHGPSPKAIEAMRNSLSETHRYPDMHAYKLKEKLCSIYNLKQENIILGNGSEGIMAYIVRAFLQPGQEVLTSEHTFIGFYILARSVGANLVTLPLQPDTYKYDVMTLARNITEKTKIIYIANPNNPTGTYITKEEFDQFMTYVPDHVLVILDEAYFEYASHKYDQYPDSMDYRYDNVITLRTFSKAYGLSGVRCGYGFAHEDLISNLHKVKLPFEPNSLAQIAALHALEDTEHLEKSLHQNNKYRKKCYEYLQQKNFKPIRSVTNFITFKTGSEEASLYLYENLLNEGVIIRPLTSNEMPDFVRVSIGTSKEMEHFFEAMDKVLPLYDKRYGRSHL